MRTTAPRLTAENPKDFGAAPVAMDPGIQNQIRIKQNQRFVSIMYKSVVSKKKRNLIKTFPVQLFELFGVSTPMCH